MKESIKNLRINIDGLAQLTKELKPIGVSSNLKEDFTDFLIFGESTTRVNFHNSKEINKAYDSLILAKAWLGKVLQELGESTPYANDGNRKEVKDIEPAADKGHIIVFEDFNHIEKVDWLREEIEKCIDLLPWEMLQRSNIEIQVNNCYTHLSEARFWLGFELGRIRDIK